MAAAGGERGGGAAAQLPQIPHRGLAAAQHRQGQVHLQEWQQEWQQQLWGAPAATASNYWTVQTPSRAAFTHCRSSRHAAGAQALT